MLWSVQVIVLGRVIVVFDGLSRHLEEHGQCQTRPFDQLRRMYVVDLRLEVVCLTSIFIFVHTAMVFPSATLYWLFDRNKRILWQDQLHHYLTDYYLFTILQWLVLFWWKTKSYWTRWILENSHFYTPASWWILRDQLVLFLLDFHFPLELI